LYIANNTGQRVDVVTDLIINDLIDQKLASLATTKVLADISERDAMTNVLEGQEVFVLDATADTDVDSGGAKYVFDGTNWIKTSEVESMDIDFTTLQIAWGQITGGPTSTPAQIDTAVSQTHTHSNKAVLDVIGEDVNGNATYKTGYFKSEWVAEEF